jgi:hypothetical protein
MVATLVPRDANEVAPMVGVWQSLRFARVWSQKVGFISVRSAGIRIQFAVNMLSHLIYTL